MEVGTEPEDSRPGARPGLVVNKEGRKPLFTSSNSNHNNNNSQDDSAANRAKPDLARYRPPHAGGDGPAPTSARRNNSESFPSHRRDSSASSAASPGGSRIPKPATSNWSHRKPLSLSEAMKMAEEEEERGASDDGRAAVDASPSPAPRLGRMARDAEQNRLRQPSGADDLEIKSPSRRLARTTDAARELGKATGSERTPWRNTRDWRSQAKANAGPSARDEANGGSGIPDLVPGIEDLPMPSVEGEYKSSPRRGSAAAKNASPEKSFGWQIEDDFTAGDLQVSDSPRIKVDSQPFANRLPFDENSEVDINSRTRVNNPGSQNTKLDEIRSREVKAGNNIPVARPHSRNRNTKIDEIRARETEVEEQIPISDRRLGTSRNTKLDDIRRRESEGLTKRQLATARLEEIREQNAASRSKSPEETRQAPGAEARYKSRWDTGGERVPDTPVTIFKNRQSQGAGSGQEDAGKTPRPGQSHNRADSRDVLRQLARAASSSPAPEVKTEKSPAKSPAGTRRSEKNVTEGFTPNTRGGPRRALTTTNASALRRSNGREARANGRGNPRPAVEFAGLRRVRSSESTGSKRSSLHSEMDPLDRIEGEARLFALTDNHSEKGSVRAPSPASGSKKDGSESGLDMTPKPKREDILAMPTPKAPGAYVETPATVKVEKFDADEPWSALRARNNGRSRQSDTASEPGEDEKPSATSSAVTRQPRARSLPRASARARAPIKNTAKLPSVKDDLRQLQQQYDIDDTTLDNIEEVLSGRKAPTPHMQSVIEDLSASVPAQADSFDLELDRYEEQSQINSTSPIKKEKTVSKTKDQASSNYDLDTLSKDLRAGIMGIRSASQGIARLEDRVSHSDHSERKTKMDTTPPPKAPATKPQHQCTDTLAPSSSGIIAYIHLPVPRLYSYHPRFHLTFLGMLTFCLVAWYSLESAMCSVYCPPKACTSAPCVWSYDDPTFGTALPVKFDQWITGGTGRVIVNSALEEAEDWIADMLDAANGREITDVDVESLSFHGKRAHRRRLRKKGLDKRGRQAELDAGPETRARWDSWHNERVARDRAREAHDMGYQQARQYDESIGGDQRIW